MDLAREHGPKALLALLAAFAVQRLFGSRLGFISPRFVFQIISIYGCFLCWGYLQEKITSTNYDNGGNNTRKWTFPCTLNLCMAGSGAATASLILAVQGETPVKSFRAFWKAALTCAAASPIGYASLQYINYPMMVLTKTMKPVPVLLVGVVGYGNRYPWYQYVTVMCLSGGLALYTFASDKGGGGGGGGGGKGKGSNDGGAALISMVTLSIGVPGVLRLTLEIVKTVWGIILVCVNLTLDGYTNNEQDKIFESDKISGLQMMKYTNIWQVFFIGLYLAIGWAAASTSGGGSELGEAYSFFKSSPEIQKDIGLFCLCASLGQILVFQIMQEHGSLVWITISITRKLFTILVSVIAFQHPLNLYQCIGIVLVFAGIALELAMKNKNKMPPLASSTGTMAEKAAKDS